MIPNNQQTPTKYNNTYYAAYTKLQKTRCYTSDMTALLKDFKNMTTLVHNEQPVKFEEGDGIIKIKKRHPKYTSEPTATPSVGFKLIMNNPLKHKMIKIGPGQLMFNPTTKRVVIERSVWLNNKNTICNMFSEYSIYILHNMTGDYDKREYFYQQGRLLKELAKCLGVIIKRLKYLETLWTILNPDLNKKDPAHR